MTRMTPEARRIILASSLGTMFEWYDFFLYGALAVNIAQNFFGKLPPATGFIFSLLAFAAGFIVRPVGALIFGRVGDLVGRKYTFLLTITIMGLSTFLVGVLPGFQTIGIAAPIILVVLRMLQGLAIGGEYGAAATYVAEYAPADQRGSWTSWIQTTSTGGLLLSLLVIIAVRGAVGSDFDAWGWRVPFLLSFVLLLMSVYVRMSMQESPAFLRIKTEGALSKAPLREAFLQGPNLRIVLTALFGLLVGQGVVWFNALFYSMFFLTQTLKIEVGAANIMVAIALVLSAPFYIAFGKLSDRIGRKPIILGGCLIAVVTLFPIFKGLTHFGNPALEAALAQAPVTLDADPRDCAFQFNPTGTAVFATSCDIAKQALTISSAAYVQADAPAGTIATIHVGSHAIASYSAAGLAPDASKAKLAAFRKDVSAALVEAGYPSRADPAAIDRVGIVALLLALMVTAAMTLAPMAAAVVELFPTRIRYSAISLPYHLANGWFGGLLPSICFALVAMRGDVYFGLWYPVIGALITVVVGLLFVKDDRGRDLQSER